MTDLSGDPAIEAKQGFERKMVTYDVPVMQYHADNESFNDISFWEDVKNSKQKIMYYDVGAHHHIGVIGKSF